MLQHKTASLYADGVIQILGFRGVSLDKFLRYYAVEWKNIFFGVGLRYNVLDTFIAAVHTPILFFGGIYLFHCTNTQVNERAIELISPGYILTAD